MRQSMRATKRTEPVMNLDRSGDAAIDARQLRHVVLDTGSIRLWREDEFGPDVLLQTRQTLTLALAGAAAVRGHRGYTLVARQVGTALQCVVIGASGILVTTGVGRGGAADADGQGLWAALVDAGGYPVGADDPPPGPWCAVRLGLGTLHDRAALDWLGPFERALAWAWFRQAPFQAT